MNKNKQIFLLIFFNINIIHTNFSTINDLITNKQYNNALELLNNKLQSNPDNFDVHYKCAEIYKAQELFDYALMHAQRAQQLQPNNYQLLLLRASTYLSIGEFPQALAIFKQLYRQHPRALSFLYNVGYTLKIAGKLDQAITIYKKVLEKQPNHEAANLALGFALLQKGNFDDGWPQHSKYLKRAHKNGDKLRHLLQTNHLTGKTILLTYEGGLGDSIQFIRYAHRLKERGARVVVRIQKPLVKLFSYCPYIDDLAEYVNRVPQHDARATLMSLPAIFEDKPKNFTKKTPYFSIPQEIIDSWRPHFAQDDTFKIGICWQASIANDASRLPCARRGIPLKLLSSLALLPNVTLYSLQRFDGVDELDDLPPTISIKQFDQQTFDKKHGPFVDTAAVMHHLDLIISVDTAVAHLAGALNRPVYLLLPFVTDWRWIHGQKTTPWYPSMKIFKQPAPFDWESVVQEVKNYLTTKIILP